MALPVLPILLIGGGIAAAIALSSGGGDKDEPRKRPPPAPPPKQDRVQTAADKTLEKIKAVKAKADAGDAKARDTLNTLKDLYGRLKG